MPSATAIRTKINEANVNSSGTVAWTGEAALKQILTDLNDSIRDKGIVVLPLNNGSPDTTALGSLGSADARIVIVEGAGLYRYDANAVPPVPSDSIQANNGGIWRLVTRFTKTYEQTMVAGVTSATVEHNFNSMYPTIIVYQKANTGSGLPYTELEGTAVTKKVTDANTVTVTIPTANAYNHLIIVKP